MPIFSEMSLTIWMEISMLPQPIGLLKLILNVICTIHIQGRELYLLDFVKFTLNTGCVRTLGTDFFRTWYDARHN